MAYPTVSAPYGLKPINLIGGQVFSGSTRLLPIQYGYNTNIFYGDFVQLVRGTIQRQTVTTGASTSTGGAGGGMVGIFLGVSYTNPTTKQKTFSQYWAAGTLAGDAQAIVADDPDTLFKVAAVTSQGGSTIASVCTPYIGQNFQASDLAGSTATGNSSNALLVSAAVSASNTGYPLRLVDVVRDTAVSVSGTGSSSSTTITLTSSLSSSLPVGTDVSYIAANGQLIQTGSFVASAYTSGTSVTLNAAIAVPGSVTAIPSGSTIVFTQYPEAIVKINFGNHEYYSNAPL
jgi:hypothetical protein